MLKRTALPASGFVLAASLVGGRALADNVDDDDLRRPERLTVDVADDLLGQLSPDGKTLYFVSNRDTANHIFAQSMADGRSRQLFDDGADVTWPKVSPDGRFLLYISFRDSASGQLCVRSLPDGDARKCLLDGSAALQAEWIDQRRIALVSRESIKGDLRIVEVTVDSTLAARPLLERNMTGPAISPDGRWLVYVPVARTAQVVGPAFAAHAAASLEAVPLASVSSARPAPIALQLPGQTGQPVFAKDGRSLFIVQFITDTNHDGTVDAGDHGVLFRVPISFGTGGTPVAGTPEQLTETSYNCEYPAPSRDRLIATCSRDATLDVYSLPLDGEVPADWTMSMLVNAIDDADTLVEEQLLKSRRLTRETTTAGRRRAMLALAMVHLQLEEFRAAEYYAEQVRTLRDETTAGISLPLRLLVEQRRAERRREQGRLVEGFRHEAEERLAQLRVDAIESPMAEDLTHLVRSEIFDSLGDLSKARSELEAVTVDETTPEPIVEAYYRQADALYRKLDDREALIATCRALSTNSALRPDEQLRYARAAVRAMVRGLPFPDTEARLARERARTNEHETELLFAIDLAHDVLAIRDSHTPQAVGDALLALYAAQTRPGRRRVLVVDAVQRADDVDADDILDALVQRDIKDVKSGTHERGEAEDIYEALILARAYERAAAKQYDAARGDFEAVAEETGSLEAEVGAIDMRLKMGETPAAIEAQHERGHARARAHFAKAYLIARQLPELEGKAHAKAASEALAALDASWSELKEERLAQALFGALLHEQYLQTGALGTAEESNMHYLIALELVAQNPRLRAMILGELGLLHTDVGNYRIALGYLLERDKLPYTDNSEGLDVLLSKAQALLHVGRATDAAAAGDAALAMIARNPALAKYRLLALDWAAVDNLAAGRFARALALYDEEISLLDASGAHVPERSRIVTRVSRAAAAVGSNEPLRALADLDYVDAQLKDRERVAVLQWPHASADDVARAYRLIASGLRANANRELGRLDAEAQAIGARLTILEQRLKETNRPEFERDEMLAEAQLAWNASQRRDAAMAGHWLGRALSRADTLRARAHGVSDREQLDVLRLAAQLTVSMGRTLVADLPRRIRAASGEMTARREPSLRSYQLWFEIYEPLVTKEAP